MKTNEKRRAEIFGETDAPNVNVKNKTLMNFNTRPPVFNSRRDLLESTKLSQLPSLPKREPNYSNRATITNQPADNLTTTECAGCNARLDPLDPIHQRFCACRRCAAIYGRILTAMDQKNERQQKFILNKMFGGQV